MTNKYIAKIEFEVKDEQDYVKIKESSQLPRETWTLQISGD